MLSLIVAAWVSLPPIDPGTPTIPPPFPTSVMRGDGTRVDCAPDYQWCWKDGYG